VCCSGLIHSLCFPLSVTFTPQYGLWYALPSSQHTHTRTQTHRDTHTHRHTQTDTYTSLHTNRFLVHRNTQAQENTHTLSCTHTFSQNQPYGRVSATEVVEEMVLVFGVFYNISPWLEVRSRPASLVLHLINMEEQLVELARR
jgi:hypothetical protein